MKISNKLQKWVDQGLISKKQAEKIMLSEQSNNSNMAWKLMYWIAGLLIGLGFILIIGSNWDAIPALIKLLGNFGIWAGILYGTYWSVLNKKDTLKEFFLALSFLFVGATIGLIAQIFNLNGGWESFATTWAILSVIFIVFSKLIAINIIWLCLLFSAIDFGHLLRWLIYFMKDELSFLIVTTSVFAFLTYEGKQLYKSTNKIIVLPKAFSYFCFVCMYFTAVFLGGFIGFKNGFANLFVLVFLGIRLLLDAKNKNMRYFIEDTRLVELYILFLFVTRFGNLFMSGIGFIFGGILLLGVLYLLKKTSKYIKAMGVFHE